MMSTSLRKTWGSEMKMMSGLWSSVKYLRLKAFLLRPSKFQVIAVKDEVGEGLDEVSEEASTVKVELSVTTSLKENCSKGRQG